MFLAFIQYLVALVYCMHGFALAFSLLVRRDVLPELGLSVRSVSLWLLTFVLYTALLTFIILFVSQIGVSNLVFFLTLNGTMFLFMILLDGWLLCRKVP
jgi:hypothetical protein